MSGKVAGPPALPVQLYYALLSDISAEAASALLTDDDRERLGDTAHPRRRTAYFVGRALLRYALQRWTNRPAHSHRLRTTGSGKPECIDGPAISISHSGNLVACALSPAGCVGIDVQFPVPQRRTEAIARQYFTLDESAWLLGQHSDRFYMLWVLKEAYLKAVGVGLAGGLDALECRIDPPEIEATAADAVSVALYSVGPAFLAIATTGYRFSEVRVQRWHPDDATAATASGIRLIARSA